MLKLAELKAALTDKATLQQNYDQALKDIEAIRLELKTAQDLAATEKTRADGLQLQIDEANNTITQLTSQVGTLQQTQKTVSEQTIEKLHELGVAANELPQATNPGQTGEDLHAQYQALNGREKTAFFRKHKAALIGATQSK